MKLQYASLFVITLTLILMSACAPLQAGSSAPSPIQTQTIPPKTTVQPAPETAVALNHTPTESPTPIVTPTLNFWQKRIPIPYNETHWKYFSLEESVLIKSGDVRVRVWGLAFVSLNKIWMASDRGLLEFKDGLSKPIDENSHLLSQVVTNVKIAPDGKIWISYDYNNAENQISSWDQKADWKDYECPGKVVDMTIAKNGIVWIMYTTNDPEKPGVSFYQNKTWHHVKIGDGPEDDTAVLSMMAASDGSVWFDTKYKETQQVVYRWYQNRLQRYDPHYTTEIKPVEEWRGAENYIREAPDGTIWECEGFTIYHFDGKNWDHYYGGHIDQFGFGGLAVSKDGKVWAGNGYIKDGKNYYFTTFPPSIHAFTIQVGPDNTIWYGTYNGIYIYDNKE